MCPRGKSEGRGACPGRLVTWGPRGGVGATGRDIQSFHAVREGHRTRSASPGLTRGLCPVHAGLWRQRPGPWRGTETRPPCSPGKSRSEAPLLPSGTPQPGFCRETPRASQPRAAQPEPRWSGRACFCSSWCRTFLSQPPLPPCPAGPTLSLTWPRVCYLQLSTVLRVAHRRGHVL